MRFTSIVLFILFFLASVVLLKGCKHDPVAPVDQNGGNGNGNGDTCDVEIIYFQNDVLPLFISNCAQSGCHDVATASDGIVLDSYSSIINSDIIEPFDAGDSEIMEVITKNDDDRMPPPPADPLSATQITLLRDWINQGTENIVCESTSCDTTSVTYAGAIVPIFQKFCNGCHSGGNPSGGLNFSTHGGIQPVALDGTLFGSVNHESGFSPMPQGGSKLPDCEIETIRIWIEDGAPNN